MPNNDLLEKIKNLRMELRSELQFFDSLNKDGKDNEYIENLTGYVKALDEIILKYETKDNNDKS